MLVYNQDIFDVLVEYEKENLSYRIKSESGKRTENNNISSVSTTKSMLSVDEVQLNISKHNLDRLNRFFTQVNKMVLSSNANFFSYLYLHNEKVSINNLTDYRNYGFLKIVLDKDHNSFIEEIPIINGDFSDIEDKVLKIINKNKSFLNHSVSNKTHKIYKNIPVVFSPHAAGFLIHEILGHTLEDDIYKYYSDNYQKLQFNSNLVVRDDPKKAPELTGINKYDDLGIPISPISLIENGKIKNILASEISDSTDGKLHGVARRESYKYNVQSRARCTYVEPIGNMSQRDIINKYIKCIFISKVHSGGITPNNGNFELNGIGYLLNDGEIKNFMGGLKLSGNLLKDFNAIEYIGNDLNFFGGYCFKLGQNVRVGIGAPTISMCELTVEGDIYE